MRRFSKFVAIDWSGAAQHRPPGIAVAMATDDETAPRLITPTPRWSRADILDWLSQQAAQQQDMLIGFDMSFALPFHDEGAYFPSWAEAAQTPRALWAKIDSICANDPHLSASSFVNHPEARRHFRHSKDDVGDLFTAGIGRLRAVERHQRETGQCASASCFNLIGAAQVGKASLTGMRLLHRLNGTIPVWPFDPVPAKGPLIIEIYTTIAARAAGMTAGRSKITDRATLKAALATLGSPCPGRLSTYNDHVSDALITAAWLRAKAHEPALWSPAPLNEAIASKEGWTFGII